LKSSQIFQCPSETNALKTDGYNGYTDYWYNIEASEQADASLDAPSLTVLFGDGISNTPEQVSNGGCVYVPCKATDIGLAKIGDGAQRHLEGANLAFADGHVKWQKSNSSNTLSGVYMGGYGTGNSKPTFRLQDANSAL
jgi:prepilin-type processing-associated H-X9-DG protein